MFCWQEYTNSCLASPVVSVRVSYNATRIRFSATVSQVNTKVRQVASLCVLCIHCLNSSVVEHPQVVSSLTGNVIPKTYKKATSILFWQLLDTFCNKMANYRPPLSYFVGMESRCPQWLIKNVRLCSTINLKYTGIKCCLYSSFPLQQHHRNVLICAQEKEGALTSCYNLYFQSSWNKWSFNFFLF